MFKAEKIESAIRERVWSISPPGQERFWTGAILSSGMAQIEDETETMELAPVSLFIAPVNRERTLRVQAGSEAKVLTIPEHIVLTSIGNGPDSWDIRRVLERPSVSQLVDRGPLAEQAERAFESILMETAIDSPGQATMIEANLKVIFGTLLRNLPETDQLPETLDRGSNLLLRFSQLLENRFRERWTVSQYASTLGIGSDRLHDLCTTKLNKSPSLLIRERTIFEAQMLLTRSSLSIMEISDRLGFRDPAHFSKYFKSATKESPRTLRQNLKRSPRPTEAAVPNFIDWP